MKPKKPRTLEDFHGAIRRNLLAYNLRAAADEMRDPADLDAYLKLQPDIDNVAITAVRSFRRRGFSWSEIGAGVGMTRQAAQQRWGGRGAGPGTPGQLHADGQNGVNE